ncbi:tyrosine-protein phosphatase non-receptor type 13-like isoform X5 [Babylonia areolata]|uniref:tyrosine-protein phosphatase non-receptor type 13-like isoform X5 n=1 Tax=Babylonia areolata TaxID=304850 RepID=UPI003FD1D9B8
MNYFKGTMSSVSLSDILEVRGGPLREREVWALLCQSAAAIQDFFIKGGSRKKDETPFVISPMTLTVCQDGQVSLTPGDITWDGSDFKAPECGIDSAHIQSDTAIEKIFLYTLGKTLQAATEYGLCKSEYVSIGHHLDSLLEAMCEENPAVRIGLRSVLEACDLHTRQHPEKTPYAQTICHLYSSVLGSVNQNEMDRSHSSDNSQERTFMLQTCRRPRLSYHLHQDRRSSPSCSPPPTHTRSRSRSRSHSQGVVDLGDGNHSLAKQRENQSEKTNSVSRPYMNLYNSTSSPPFTAATGILATITTTSCSTIPNRGPSSSQDLNVSFTSSAGDQASFYHPAPAYQAFSAMPGPLSLDTGSPAYEKYLQLKERGRRLKAAKIGRQADSEGMGYGGMSALYPVPSPCVTWQGNIMDCTNDSHSLASLMSSAHGSCMPDLTSTGTNPVAPVVHMDLDGGSLLSSDLAYLIQDDPQTNLKWQKHSQAEELKQPHVEASSCLKRRHNSSEEQQKGQSDMRHEPQQMLEEFHHRVDNSPQSPQQPCTEYLGKHSDQQDIKYLKEQSTPSQQKQMEAHKQQLPVMQQFGSRDFTPTPDALPAKEYYGPEFVYRASHSVVRISLPLQGESIKNPALARRIIIVHLTGQKFEVIVDPCMTGRQLFDAVVTHIGLDDYYFFGLTYICEGEHFFLDADTKLHRMSPQGWREGAKGHMPPVTFTLYLRVKFYPDSLSDFRHMSSQHLLYLQLRRDVLEERCVADDHQLLSLSGLALHAEFGDYSHRTMGHNYFVPEQYLPAHTARRLGMGYVHDRALEAHRDALGLAPSQCEIQFIKMVQRLPEYGIHYYKLQKTKNDANNLLWVGITQTSLLIAEWSGSQRTVIQAFSWPAIMKISFNKRRFSVQPKIDPAVHIKGKPAKISFFTNSFRKGRYLLQMSTAQHRFHIRMRTRATALENFGGHEELEDPQSDSFTSARQQTLMNRENEREGAEEEKEEEGQQMQLKTPVETCSEQDETECLNILGKQLVIPETETRSSVWPEESSEVRPLKYRNPPPYSPNLSCLMEELSADSSVHARDTVPVTTASPDMHASVTFDAMHETEQDTIPYDATSPLANHILSPQLSKHFAADLSSHDHPPSHHHRPAFHLASGQPSLGRQITEVTLQKEGDKGIGITIVGGETTNSLDLGIFVKSVMKDGPAARTGQIKAGDRLIAINGISLEGVQHHEAVQLIRDSVRSVRLLLSQMQPPVSIKQKLNGVETKYDIGDSDAVHFCDDEDLKTRYVHSDYSNDIPSDYNTAASHSHHLPVLHSSHFHSYGSDLTVCGNMEPETLNNSLPECLALHYDSASADTKEEMLFSEDMLSAADLDSESYGSGDISLILDAETELDKERQELHIVGDIATMTVDNSDTDSDFESAVQETVEGKVTMSVCSKTGAGSLRGLKKFSSPLKAISDSSSDTVIYEVVLEKEQGSLGIITSEGDNCDRNKRLYVQSLVPGGPAELGGILQPGDYLLELNGQSLCGVTRTDLGKALLSAPDICLLKIARTKSLDDLTQDQYTEQVNGESLIGCSHTKAVRLLREATGSVILSIFRSSESHFDSNDTEGTDILPRDDSHPGSKKNSHPTPSSSTYSSDYPYDDNINDILDEAINVLDSQDKEVTKNLKPGSGEQNLLMSTGIRKQSTPDQGEQYPPTSTIHAESCLQSNPRIMDYCCSSKYSPLPVHEEVSGLSNKMCEKHEEGKMKCTSYAQKLSSVEIPEDLTSMSLPILRMTKEVEEKTVQLLQFLADAVEQEEPLLEFEKLRQMKATDNMEVAKLPENKSLNRYRNVLPWSSADHTGPLLENGVGGRVQCGGYADTGGGVRESQVSQILATSS